MNEIEIKVEVRPGMSLAAQQNGYPLMRKVRVRNRSSQKVEGVTVRFSFDPEFASAEDIRIESIPAGKSKTVENWPVDISTGYLANLTESVEGKVALTVSDSSGAVLTRESITTRLYPYDRWDGFGNPELLASFVVPNHPALKPIIARASELLGKWTGNPSLDAYQSGDSGRVRNIMGAVLCAMAEQGIIYSEPPANCGEPGQRIRMPEEILSSHLATCLDTSALYASCLEAVGLRSVIALTGDHAFAGAWLAENSSPDIVNGDPAALRKRAADGINEILLVETTSVDKGRWDGFEPAVASAESTLASCTDFQCWVDIEAARRMDITPLPQRVLTPDGYVIVKTEKTRRSDRPDEIADMDEVNLDRRTVIDKKGIWERKLLDLSLRNRLLNFRATPGYTQFANPDPVMLSDALEGCTSLRMSGMPLPFPDREKGCPVRVLTDADPESEYVRKELGDSRIHLFECDPQVVETVLTDIRSKAKGILEECGANSLYMTIGSLKWFDDRTSKPHHAPLILYPVEFSKTGDSIHGNGEEPVVNMTLLEMLRQKFNLSIPGLDPLPRKGESVDVQLVLNTFRKAVMQFNGWDVDPLVFLGTFNFNKFVMWNDVHTHSDMLEENPITRSLLTGKLQVEDVPDDSSEPLDTLCPSASVLLPMEADSSQLRTIHDSMRGRTMIVQGPPGTGKSQTITNIIANALYEGKRVLFVSEKKAALEVVQRRLAAIGLDPFCLELHSDKTVKSRVLKKLEDTLSMERPAEPETFVDEACRMDEHKAVINAHSNGMHARHASGLSLYDCIGDYCCSDVACPEYAFPEGVASMLTPRRVKELDAAVGEFALAALHSSIGANHPLNGLPVNGYTQKLEKEIRGILQKAVSARNPITVIRAGKALERLLGKDMGVLFSMAWARTFRETAGRWLSGLGDLRRYAIYMKGRDAVNRAGAGFVAESFENGTVPADRITDAWRKSLSRAVAEDILGESSELSTFCGELFECRISAFRKLTEAFRGTTRRQIVSRVASRLPDVTREAAADTQMWTLKRAMRNSARGMSLRTLFSKVPDLLPQICPCMLMSPLSVAQYLPAASGVFDIVIFDEASQMPTSEAVGAIARGRTLIVVGDPKQLPPTTFFETDNFDAENADTEDLESILDDCIALSIPSNQLRWHYRSRHESLVAFSNLNYYDGRLLTFPSKDDTRSRVKFTAVDGVYDRGRTRQNIAEADAIVERVRELLSDSGTGSGSIGVITFNVNQRSLIERKLEALYRKEPELRKAADREDEPLFVKSLENVQGDERDIILFSIGYGRDKDGRLSLNLGPLNSAGGWRRLNVAVSRARRQMEVFSTMKPEDMQTDRYSPRGVADLKAFLLYARDGKLPECERSSVCYKDPLAESIAEEVRREGRTAVTGIGTSDFRIDVGVLDPKWNGEYSCGILCDGPVYASAETAADREVIRPSVLTGLGWDIRRAWALDRWNSVTQGIQDSKPQP